LPSWRQQQWVLTLDEFLENRKKNTAAALAAAMNSGSP